jgi:hypothetical protein
MNKTGKQKVCNTTSRFLLEQATMYLVSIYT